MSTRKSQCNFIGSHDWNCFLFHPPVNIFKRHPKWTEYWRCNSYPSLQCGYFHQETVKSEKGTKLSEYMWNCSDILLMQKRIHKIQKRRPWHLQAIRYCLLYLEFFNNNTKFHRKNCVWGWVGVGVSPPLNLPMLCINECLKYSPRVPHIFCLPEVVVGVGCGGSANSWKSSQL